MPTASPTSLGDAKTAGLVRVRETSPLPAKRDLIVAEVNRILTLGLVQKLVVEVEQPIVYERLVKPEDAGPEMETVQQMDLYGAIRNNELVEFREADEFRGRGPFGIMFFAFQELAKRGAVPLAFVSSNWSLVRAWLGLSSTYAITTIYGVNAITYGDVQQLPEDCLLLVGGDAVDSDVVKVTFKISIDLPRKKR
jgi:hypothetical protein